MTGTPHLLVVSSTAQRSGCFTICLTGGGFPPGTTYGKTDAFGVGAIKDPVHARDIHAPLLHLTGLNHERRSVGAQDLDVRLTGIHPAKVLNPLLASAGVCGETYFGQRGSIDRCLP